EGDSGWEAQTQARPLPSPKTDGTLPPASPATTSPLDATDSKTAMPANSPALTSPPSPSATGSVSAIPPTGQTTTQPRESAGTAGGAPASEECHIAVGPFGKSVRSPPVSDEEFARELFVMEIELGQIVAGSPERWNLGGMEQKAQLLLSRAKTDTQKQSALALSARLSRFVAIRRQYELMPSTDAILASRGIRTPPPASNLPNTVAQ